MQINNVEVIVEGAGAKSIVMVHGWPDTHRLWDAQVAALSERYRCVRFTLPGFEPAAAKRAYSLDEIVETLRQIVARACPGERVTLLLHDWGCLFGYQLAQRHPQLVERVVGVDVGDAGSHRNVAELSRKARLMVVFYQLWLAMAWWIGSALGDRMARGMARALRCPVAAEAIHSRMGYPYAVRWLRLAGGWRGLRAFHPQTPMLFVYGERKPFMFHSRAWAAQVAAQRANRVLGLPTGHWVMIGRAREFNDALLSWLAESESQEASSGSSLK